MITKTDEAYLEFQ